MCTKDKSVSFIIPHKGRFEMLEQTLASIAQQDYPSELVEVVVVSQTPEIEHQTFLNDDGFNLKILTCETNATISALRNRGVNVAKGEFLAFLDADVAISPNWTSVMLQHLCQDNRRVITSAMQVCEESATSLEHIRTALSNTALDCNVRFLPGRNLFMHRKRFEQIGGFPEHLVTCEDYYFTDKAAQIGQLYYTSDASYIHLGEDKILGEMFKKEIWRGQSNLQSMQGRHIPIGEIPSFVVPSIICLSLILALISLVLQAHVLATIFALMGLVPLLAYSIRLYLHSPNNVSFFDILTFYTVYFPARTIGTLTGLFKAVDAGHQ
jgi:glycosyltransferase involved in cell wall biosynthesis